LKDTPAEDGQMLHFPLLSDAYAAVLFGAGAPRTGQVPLGSSDACDPLVPEPSRAPDEEDEDGTHDEPDADEDFETARTRPLRLDQIRL
jgi:hypothetical protein